MKFPHFTITIFILLFSITLSSKTVYYTHVNSTAGGTQGIAVRITIPDTSRYTCGAPVFMFLKGGSSPTTMDLSSIKSSDYGVITIDFNFPNGGNGVTKSGGIYDLRGINCVTATKDVALFAQGLVPDVNGNYLSFFSGSITPLYHNFGLLGSSEAGNIAATVAGLFPQSLPYLKWIAFWESPFGYGTAAFDPGYSDYIPTYNTGYNDSIGIFDWNDLRYDSTEQLEVATLIDPAIIGGYYFDTNHNGHRDSNEYMTHGQTNKHHYYLSSQTMEHAYALNRLPTVWPSHFNTLNETHDFWNYRSGESWIDSAFNHFPNLIVIIATTDTDHVSTAPDHPHALYQYTAGMNHQLPVVRLNTDRIYAEEILKHTTTLGCDNDANIPLDHLNIRNHIQYEQLLSEVNFKVALVLESADRTQFGIIDANMNAKPGKNCLNNFSVSVQLIYNNCDPQKQLIATPNRTSLYTYSWLPATGLSNAHISNPIFTDNADRTYTVTVYNPITEQTATATIFVSRIDQLSSTHSLISGSSCSIANGSAQVSVSGNYPPYHILWNDLDTVFQKNNFTAGNKSFVITDANGCQLNDSILIPSLSVCSPATVNGVSNYIDSALIVNWSNTSCNSTVKIFYRIAGNSNWDSTLVYNQNTDTLRGLIPETNYLISIASVCQTTPWVQSVLGNTISATTRPHSCFAPTYFNANNILQTEVDIHWQPNAGLLAWEFSYKADTASTWNLVTVNAADSFVHLTGLNANTAYTVRLRSQCFNNPVVFGDYSILNFQTIAYQCNNVLNLNLDSMTYNRINVSWNSTSNATYYRISYQTAGNTSWSYFNTNQTHIQISNLTPGTAYFVRVNSFCNVSNSFSSYVDTLVVTTPFPGCNSPYNFQTVSIGVDTVSLIWTLNSYNTSSILEYKTTTASAWQSYTVNAPLHSKIVRNLTASTTYMFRVKCFCTLGNNYSVYSDTILATTANQICPIPTGLSATNITSTKATVNWNALTPSYPVKLKYTNLSNNTAQSVLCAANTTSKNLKNLIPNTNYRVILSAKCGTVFSTPSALLYFTTLPLRTSNPEINFTETETQTEISIAPNPFDQNFSVNFLNLNSEKIKIEIFNVLGQSMQQQSYSLQSSNGSIQMTTTDWPAGLYFVQVTFQNGEQSFRLIHN